MNYYKDFGFFVLLQFIMRLSVCLYVYNVIVFVGVDLMRLMGKFLYRFWIFLVVKMVFSFFKVFVYFGMLEYMQ